jgi:RNA polymerase sigma factor (sigma-70 family)
MKTLPVSRSKGGTSTPACQELDAFTCGYVRKAARQLAGQYGFRRGDRDEIEQRLYLKLVRRLHQADPQDPKWKAFVAKTVSRHIASMIRDARAEKRDHRRTTSIHVVIGSDDSGPIELADTIGEDETPSRRLRDLRGAQDLTEMRIDLDACIDTLPDGRQREFCERLKRDSISQVARDMGIARTTLNTWLGKLRRRFEECGLRDYVERPSSVR